MVYYGNTRKDAAGIDFNDDLIYRELSRPIKRRQIRMAPLLRAEAREAFRARMAKPDRVAY